MEQTQHDITIYDVTDDGRLCVSYNRVSEGGSATEALHVHDRVPVEVGVLFDGERVRIGDLTTEERAWIAAEAPAIGEAMPS